MKLAEPPYTRENITHDQILGYIVDQIGLPPKARSDYEPIPTYFVGGGDGRGPAISVLEKMQTPVKCHIVGWHTITRTEQETWLQFTIDEKPGVLGFHAIDSFRFDEKTLDNAVDHWNNL